MPFAQSKLELSVRVSEEHQYLTLEKNHRYRTVEVSCIQTIVCIGVHNGIRMNDAPLDCPVAVKWIRDLSPKWLQIRNSYPLDSLW